MKRFEDFTTEDLQKLRGEIVLNSIFVHDYSNSFGISAQSVCTFFEGYVEYLEELADEDGYEWEYWPTTHFTWEQFVERYDTPDNLQAWFDCHDDMSWVEYE